MILMDEEHSTIPENDRAIAPGLGFSIQDRRCVSASNAVAYVRQCRIPPRADNGRVNVRLD